MFTTYLVFALSLTASTSALVTPHAPRNAHTHHAIAARVASPVPVAPLVTKKSLRKRCVARNSTASVSSILSSVVASSTPTVVNVAPVPVISSTEAAPTTSTKTKAATTSTKAATTSTKAAATSTKTSVSSTKVAATSTEATPTSTKVETSTLLVPSTTSSTHTTTKHSTTTQTPTTTQIPTTSTTTHTPTTTQTPTTTTKHTSTSSSSTSTTAATKTTAASSSSSTEPSFMIGTQTGQGTYYGTGLGACGITNSDTDYIAAASELLFDTFPGYNGLNPNNNPICGLKVKATYEGKSVTVAITDRCTACAITDLDFSPTAFNQIADPTVGRISGMTWVWV